MTLMCKDKFIFSNQTLFVETQHLQTNDKVRPEEETNWTVLLKASYLVINNKRKLPGVSSIQLSSMMHLMLMKTVGI